MCGLVGLWNGVEQIIEKHNEKEKIKLDEIQTWNIS